MPAGALEQIAVPGRAVHVSDGALLAAYERAAAGGSAAAAFRARILRAKLEGEA